MIYKQISLLSMISWINREINKNKLEDKNNKINKLILHKINNHNINKIHNNYMHHLFLIKIIKQFAIINPYKYLNNRNNFNNKF